jgi:hypothetical protein
MALPTSGPLSLSMIGAELNVGTPFSLRNMSSNAGFGTPDAVSDFYGYGPSCLPYGTFLYQSCNGCEEIYHYADGSCGEYTQIIDYNSPNCGCGGGLTLFFVSEPPTNIPAKICDINPSCCTPVWHNGSGTLPIIGDLVFTDSGGTTPLTGFKGQTYFGMDSGECNPAFNWLFVDELGSGQVFDTGGCFAGPEEPTGPEEPMFK